MLCFYSHSLFCITVLNVSLLGFVSFLFVFHQYTGETLGQAERTEFDTHLERLLALAESTKEWSDQIIAQTEVLLQPNPGEAICPSSPVRPCSILEGRLLFLVFCVRQSYNNDAVNDSLNLSSLTRRQS